MPKKIQKQAGFTIVEVLVSAFIFSIIALTVSSIFIQVLTVQRRAFASQKIQENGLYVMELMSREIRVSQIQNQDSSTCSRTDLTIIHPENGTVVYNLASDVLQRIAGGVTTNLTTSGVSFTRLNFCVLGSGPNDDQQARVTIIATIKNKTGREVLTANLETTVSSRDVQTEF